jgi:chromate transporter
MMEEEFVRRRGSVSHADFLDLLGASNLVPGPSSTEMAIHIGHQRVGWRGLVVAGVCFIFRAMLIVMACAWAYAVFGSLPQVQSVLHGVKPVIIALVLQALWGLGRTAIKNGFLLAVGLLGMAARIAGGMCWRYFWPLVWGPYSKSGSRSVVSQAIFSHSRCPRDL